MGFKTNVATVTACSSDCAQMHTCNIYQFWPQQKFCWFWMPGTIGNMTSKTDFTCGYRTGGNNTPIKQFRRVKAKAKAGRATLVHGRFRVKEVAKTASPSASPSTANAVP